MLFPNPDMLFYIAMADAYAMGVEYLDYRKPERQKVLQECLLYQKYVQHPIHKQPYGCYTDDTEMSIGCARVLLEHDFPYKKIDFANAWVWEFIYAGERKGYSKALQTIMESCHTGQDLLDRLRGHNNSNKNGGAMRAVPIGVLPDIKQVIETADLQASITHNTIEGRFAAIVVAVMSHFALYENRPLTEIREYCVEHVGQWHNDESIFWLKKHWNDSCVKEYEYIPVSIATIQAVMTLLTECNSLMEMMTRCLNWGGDTDTVAGLSWAIASSRMRGEKIPPFLLNGLEAQAKKTHGKRVLNISTLTGKNRLIALGHRLMKKYS